MKIAYAMTAICLIFVGCGKLEKQAPKPLVTDPSKIVTSIEGPYSEALNKMRAGNWADECEVSQKAIQDEIAHALDSRKSEIEAFVKSAISTWEKAPPRNGEQYQSFQGGLIQVSPLSTPSAKPTDSYSKSWQKVYEDYQKIKDTPVDGKWAHLNARVQGILSDDTNRTVAGVNLYIFEKDVPLVGKLYAAVKACYLDSLCVDPKLDSEVDAFAKNQWFYAQHFRELENFKTFEGKRLKIKNFFENRLTFDQQIFVFEPQSTMKVSRDQEKMIYTLPVNGSPLTSDEQAFVKKYVESTWKSDKAEVRLEFTQSSALDSKIYQLSFQPVPGRDATSASKKIIKLFNLTTTKAIAHEFGHAFGFADHYYTIWSPEACAYTVNTNELDLMSQHEPGVVTDFEWSQLLEYYPAQ